MLGDEPKDFLALCCREVKRRGLDSLQPRGKGSLGKPLIARVHHVLASRIIVLNRP
jgi:hypothetical protein